MDELPAHAKAVLRRAHQHDQAGADEARRRVREGVARAVGASGADASVFARSRGQAQPAVPAGASSGSAPLLGLAGKLAATTVLVALVGTGIAVRQRGAESHESGGTRASVVVSAPAVQQGEPVPVGTDVRVSSGSRAEQSRRSTGAERARAVQDERAVDEQRSTTAQPEDRRARVALPGSRAPSRTSTLRSRAEEPRASTRDTLAVEVALLRQLGEAVSRRDTFEARRLLALHRARFAQPALLEERQGFQALVRCMEESPDALVSSRAFVARYPNSVLTARVLHECEPERR